MRARLYLAMLAAAALLAGCFESKTPLFAPGEALAVFGTGKVKVENLSDKPDQTEPWMDCKSGVCRLDENGEVSIVALYPARDAAGKVQPFIILQSHSQAKPGKDGGGVIYIIYKQIGPDLLESWPSQCSLLSEAEAKALQIVRDAEGKTCEVSSKTQLVEAFKLIYARSARDETLRIHRQAP